MRYADVLQSEAVSECIYTDVGHSIRQFNRLNFRAVHERENANRLQLTTIFEFNCGYVLACICKCVVTDGGDILANNNAGNHVGIIYPRLLSVVGVIGHSTSTADHKLAAGINIPLDGIIVLAGVNRSHVSFSGLILQPILDGIFLSNRFLHYVQNQVRVCTVEDSYT